MSSKCLIDMDGVIIELLSEVRRTLGSWGLGDFNISNVLTYDFNKSLESVDIVSESLLSLKDRGLGVSRKDIFDLFVDPDFFGRCNFYTGVVDAIVKLSKVMPVEIYTQSLNQEVADTKRDILSKAFGEDFGRIEYTPIVKDVKPAVEDAKYIIEDSIENLSRYDLGETKGYLIDKSYNQVEYNREYEEVFNDVTRKLSCVYAIQDILWCEKSMALEK